MPFLENIPNADGLDCHIVLIDAGGKQRVAVNITAKMAQMVLIVSTVIIDPPFSPFQVGHIYMPLDAKHPQVFEALIQDVQDALGDPVEGPKVDLSRFMIGKVK